MKEGQQLSTDQALANLNEVMLQNMRAAEASSGQADAAAALASALAEQGLDLAENMQASGLAVSDTWSIGGSAEQLAAGGGPGMGQGVRAQMPDPEQAKVPGWEALPGRDQVLEPVRAQARVPAAAPVAAARDKARVRAAEMGPGRDSAAEAGRW